MKKKYLYFFYGLIFHAGVILTQQDLMGVDAYIEHIRANWTEMSPLWGIAFASFGFIGGINSKDVS